MILNEYVGLYFFSAIFQGNMALLALLGVFVVFKRQEITSEIQGKESTIVTFVQNYLDLFSSLPKHVPIIYSNVDSLRDILLEMSSNQNLSDTIRDRAKALHDDPNLSARLSERKALLDKRTQIAKSMAPAFLWIITIVVLSLLSLPSVHSIHTTTPWLELILIVSTIIANIWALVVTKKFVWTMLNT